MANFGYTFLLILTAFIWGTTFVAQAEGNDVGPFTFTTIRNFIATFLLFGMAKVLDFAGKSPRRPKTKEDKIKLWKAGILCGIALTFGTNLQQLGLFLGCSAGKTGFVTTCYIVLVPVLSVFLGKKISKKIWFCVGLTLVGLYLLCMTEGFSLQIADGVLLLCALAFATQILVVDKFGTAVDNIRLSAIQCLVTCCISAFPMVFFDLKCSLSELYKAMEVYSHTDPWIPLLYAAVLSSGVAYTLQIIAQNKIRPTIASMLMSLESVFAVLGGWVVLNEHLSLQEAVGCTLMFTAVILAQVKLGKE